MIRKAYGTLLVLTLAAGLLTVPASKVLAADEEAGRRVRKEAHPGRRIHLAGRLGFLRRQDGDVRVVPGDRRAVDVLRGDRARPRSIRLAGACRVAPAGHL